MHIHGLSSEQVCLRGETSTRSIGIRNLNEFGPGWVGAGKREREREGKGQHCDNSTGRALNFSLTVCTQCFVNPMLFLIGYNSVRVLPRGGYSTSVLKRRAVKNNEK